MNRANQFTPAAPKDIQDCLDSLRFPVWITLSAVCFCLAAIMRAVSKGAVGQLAQADDVQRSARAAMVSKRMSKE